MMNNGTTQTLTTEKTTEYHGQDTDRIKGYIDICSSWVVISVRLPRWKSAVDFHRVFEW